MNIMSTHIFNFEFSCVEENLKLKAKIEEIIFNGKNYYRLNYLYGDEMNINHELKRFNDFGCVKDSLVYKNSFSKKIFDYILMSDEDLMKNIDTDTMTPLDFKKRLLVTFKILID